MDETEAEKLSRESVEVEAKAAVWRSRSSDYLVGYLVGRETQSQNIALAELQRRLILELSSFNATSTRQTDRVIRLTEALRLLTWVLIGLSIVQLLVPLVRGS